MFLNTNMKDSFIKQCLDIFKREDVKQETKMLMTPIIDIILHEIYPYLYLMILLVALIFILILAILFILVFLLRNKNVFNYGV
jgi:hypothetical protein